MVTAAIVCIALLAFLGAPIFAVLSSLALLGFHLSDIRFAALIVDQGVTIITTPIRTTVPPMIPTMIRLMSLGANMGQVLAPASQISRVCPGT